MSISDGGANENGSLLTQVWVLRFGETNLAVDGMDSNPGCFSILDCYAVAFSGKAAELTSMMMVMHLWKFN